MSGDDVYWCLVLGAPVGLSVFNDMMVGVADDAGDQRPSVIISVWVPECWVCVYITYEYGNLCVGDVLYTVCYVCV